MIGPSANMHPCIVVGWSFCIMTLSHLGTPARTPLSIALPTAASCESLGGLRAACHRLPGLKEGGHVGLGDEREGGTPGVGMRPSKLCDAALTMVTLSSLSSLFCSGSSVEIVPSNT